jgi:hypothetical protein
LEVFVNRDGTALIRLHVRPLEVELPRLRDTPSGVDDKVSRYRFITGCALEMDAQLGTSSNDSRDGRIESDFDP